jgi:hypothetical protein
MISELEASMLDNNLVSMMSNVSTEKPELFKALIKTLKEEGLLDVVSKLDDGVDKQWYQVLNDLREAFKGKNLQPEIAEAQFQTLANKVGIKGTRVSASDVRGGNIPGFVGQWLPPGKADLTGESIGILTNKVINDAYSIRLNDITRLETRFKELLKNPAELAKELGKEDVQYLAAERILGHDEEAQHRSSGGLIYASNGKYIDFKSKGTDTVPAMLTPGEFVVNKKATQNNLPLLRSINNGQNPAYFQNGGMIGSNSTTGNSGGGRSDQSGVLDIDSLNSSFDNFNRSVDKLKSVIDSFVETGNKISSAFGQLNSIESGAAKLSVAAISINSASSNFNNTINGFNTSLRSLERAIANIPSNISLNINGSIPVNVTVEMNGEAIQQDMPELRGQILSEVENALRNAMPGLNINMRR